MAVVWEYGGNGLWPERQHSIVRRQHKGVLLAGIVGLLTITAICISLGHLQEFQNADSIVPVLVSLQHWTPFYWSTNRYGMLVPLLVRPIHNPLTNLLTQSFLTTFAGLAASYLLIAYLLDSSALWFSAAALQNLWLLLLVPGLKQFDWFIGQCYAVSFSLGVAALICLEKKRLWKILGVCLMLLAHWVSSATFILLIPLVLGHWYIRKNWRGLVLPLAVIALSTTVGIVSMNRSRFRYTETKLLPASIWFKSASDLIHTTRLEIMPHPQLLLWVLLPAVVGLTRFLRTRNRRPALLAAATLVASAVAYWLFVATLVWVKDNAYAPRYVYPSLLLFTTAMGILAVAVVYTPKRNPEQVALSATFILLLVTFFCSGTPSVSRIHSQLDQAFGSVTADVISSRAVLIAGNYWGVWPAVFHANLTLFEHRDHRRIYGLTYRDEPTVRAWRWLQHVCAAAPLGDQDAVPQITNTGLGFRRVQTLPTVDIYCRP